MLNICCLPVWAPGGFQYSKRSRYVGLTDFGINYHGLHCCMIMIAKDALQTAQAQSLPCLATIVSLEMHVLAGQLNNPRVCCSMMRKDNECMSAHSWLEASRCKQAQLVSNDASCTLQVTV